MVRVVPRRRITPGGRRFKSCPRYKESPGQPPVDLDFSFGGSHPTPQDVATIGVDELAAIASGFEQARPIVRIDA